MVLNDQRETFGLIWFNFFKPPGVEKVQGGDLPKLWWEKVDWFEGSQAKKGTQRATHLCRVSGNEMWVGIIAHVMPTNTVAKTKLRPKRSSWYGVSIPFLLLTFTWPLLDMQRSKSRVLSEPANQPQMRGGQKCPFLKLFRSPVFAALVGSLPEIQGLQLHVGFSKTDATLLEETKARHLPKLPWAVPASSSPDSNTMLQSKWVQFVDGETETPCDPLRFQVTSSFFFLHSFSFASMAALMPSTQPPKPINPEQILRSSRDVCFFKLKWTSRNPPWTGLWEININLPTGRNSLFLHIPKILFELAIAQNRRTIWPTKFATFSDHFGGNW